MGLHLNWLAIEGDGMGRLLARLGFQPSGVVSDPLQARFACATLPNGWMVIVSAEFELDLSRLLPLASAEGLAVGCDISEIVMASRVRAFQNGRRLWAVNYDCERGSHGLEIEGDPPAELREIRARLQREQAEAGDEPVDYIFDAPAELARSVCGFRIEDWPPAEWTVLRGSQDRGWSGPPAETLADTLADRIRSDLVPLLRSLGWEEPPGRAGSPGFHDVARVRGGRREVLWLTWWPEAPETYISPYFVVWRGETTSSGVLVSGDVGREPERFWTRFRNLFGPTRAAEDRPAQVIAEARRDILAIDRLLTQGERAARIRLTRGASADLRPTGSGEQGPAAPQT